MSGLEDDSQVIMVTSSVPREGKSTFATNLAHSLSKLENVLLIEADLRRPGIGRALGVKAGGLGDLLERGGVYLDDCIRKDVIGRLDVLPAGRSRDSGLELLASAKFGHMMQLLRTKYDRIVLDLAPVHAVSDALVVGEYVDAAVYVVKADSTPLPVVERGISLLQDAGVFIAGAVISQVDIDKLSAYGGDNDYIGYFDYYGYAEDDAADNRRGGNSAMNYARRSQTRERTREIRHRGGRNSLRRRDSADRDEEAARGDEPMMRPRNT